MRKIKLSATDSLELHPYAGLLQELGDLRKELENLEHSSSAIFTRTNPLHLASTINLIHYLGLRNLDMRPLQERLSKAGLSSLGPDCVKTY